MGTCSRCGYRGAGVHYSEAGRAMLCLSCYGRLPESVPRLPRGWKSPVLKPPPAYKPTRGALLWRQVFERLKSLTDSEVFHTADGTGRMAAYCPVCKVACIAVQIVDVSTGPELRVNGCDNGCTAEQIARVLLTRGKT